MVKFLSEKLVTSSVPDSLQLFSDFENYSEIFPDFYPYIKVKSVRDNSALVVEHLHLCDNEFVIMAKHEWTPTHHQMRVVGGDIKGSHITQDFISHGSQTLIKFSAEIKFSGISKLSNYLSKNKIEECLNELFDEFLKKL